VLGSVPVRIGELALIWGCSFLFIKVGLEGLTPSQVVIGRVLFGATALVLVATVRRQPLPRDGWLWFHLSVFAVIGNLVPYLLFAWGEERISSGRAGVLNATTPLCTLVAAMVFLPEERPTAARLVGLVIGFAGVVVVVAPWADAHGGGGSLTAQLACLAAAALYGVSFPYTRRFISSRSGESGPLATAQMLAASALVLLALPVVGWRAPDLSVRIVLAVAALGALGTGVAYLIYHGLIRDAGATTTSLVTYFIPIVAVVLGIVVLDEPVTWNLFAGAAVVCAGVAVAEGRIGPGQRGERRATMLRRT
jgi:drug/metabolite transporter (DMT)-like permease